MSTETTVQTDPYEELERRRRQGLEGGGERYIEKIRATGRQTARERIDQLIDPGSWYELGMLAEPEYRRPDKVTTGDGVITGLGRIDGRRVAIIAIDTTVLTGTTAPVNMRKQNRVAEWAARAGFPLICLSDNDGGRLPDLLGWRFSSVPFDFTNFIQSPAGQAAIPRMTAILGPSYGDAAEPELAARCLELLVGQARALGASVVTGVFRAHMEVELVNDGPVTLLLDSRGVF